MAGANPPAPAGVPLLAPFLSRRSPVKEILDFIRSYRSQRGISPTQREIRENFGLSSFGTIQKHLKRLEEKLRTVAVQNKASGEPTEGPA